MGLLPLSGRLATYRLSPALLSPLSSSLFWSDSDLADWQPGGKLEGSLLYFAYRKGALCLCSGSLWLSSTVVILPPAYTVWETLHIYYTSCVYVSFLKFSWRKHTPVAVLAFLCHLV